MSHPNKVKGTRWESEVASFLNVCGLDARRTGSADAGSGDIHFSGEWTVEAKNEARINLPGYLAQLGTEVTRSGRYLHKAAVWVKRRQRGVADAYVVMSGEAYRDLVCYVVSLEDAVSDLNARGQAA